MSQEQNKLKQVAIYTDGSCLGNGKANSVGGYGAILLYPNGKRKVVKGSHPNTTNNRMELLAVVEAVDYLKNGSYNIKLFSDSQLVIKQITGEYKRRMNLDLWKRFDNAVINHKIKSIWVKGHNGNKLNEEVDLIAYTEAKKLQELM